ncbi:MAG TPA: hypothetical protein VIY48_19635 [Candidatus Paceibacterota bacterium]
MNNVEDIRNAINTFVDTVESELVQYEFRKQEVTDTLQEMVAENRNVEVIYEYLTSNTPIFDGLLRTVLRITNTFASEISDTYRRQAYKK